MSWRAEKPSAPDERVVRGPSPEHARRRVAMRIVAIILALFVGMIGGCAMYLLLQAP